MSKCKHELSFPKFHKKELSLWSKGNRQEEKILMKIQSLPLRGEEDLLQRRLLRHKEEGVIMMQMMGWLPMGNLMKMCDQDAAHNARQTALQGEGAVAQAIALLHQVKTKEGTQGTREGGHQLLHPLLLIQHQRLHCQNPFKEKSPSMLASYVEALSSHGKVQGRREKCYIPFL